MSYIFDHDHEFHKTLHLKRSPKNPVIIFPPTSSSKPPSTFLLPASWHVFFWSYPRKIHVVIYVFLFMCFYLCVSIPDIYLYIYIPVVPGQAGGGSFQKEKNYIAQKEFAYRMCAGRPTSAMPKSFLGCERAFCRSMVVMFCALK